MPSSCCGWLRNRLALKRDGRGHHWLSYSLTSHRCPAGGTDSARPGLEKIVTDLVGEEGAEEMGKRKRKRMEGVKEERRRRKKTKGGVGGPGGGLGRPRWTSAPPVAEGRKESPGLALQFLF